MSERDAELLDAYLDACLEGTAPEPAAFAREHPTLGAAARARLETMFTMAAGAEPSGDDRTSPNGEATHGEARTQDVTAPQAGAPDVERVGEFRLLERLGAGGMGMVFLAEQESLARHVAVKMLHPALLQSPTAVERFRREARALAKLKHANVVEVYAVGEESGRPYIAMELVHGRTLSDVLADGKDGETPSIRRFVRWVRDIARALHAAHESGIVHRDVKPANIRVADDGQPRLLDFGIARDDAFDAALTHTFAGSPLYAAPEQITGAELDARADVYGLGVTLYECLAGRVPFAGGPFEQIVKRVLDEDPVSPRLLNPSVSRDLDVVCRKALEKDPDARYTTAQAFADDLTAVLEDRPIAARPPSRRALVRKWCRRNPARATAVLSGVAVALLLAGFLVVQGIAAERKRKEDARTLVETARERLRAYRAARARTRSLDQEIGRIHNELTYRYLAPKEMRTLDVAEDDVERARREREAMFYGVLDALRQAEKLDAAVPGASDVRTELFVEKWTEARSARDSVTAAFYRERIEQSGGATRLPDGRALTQRIRITSDPPGATVHLFRFVELSKLLPGGRHRLVAVPATGQPVGCADTWALRVARGAGEVPAGTEIVAVAGRPIRGTWFVAEDAGPLRRMDVLQSIDETQALDLEPEDLVTQATDPRRFSFARGGETITLAGAEVHGAGAAFWTPRRIAERGAVEATVWRAGLEVEQRLPQGLALRTTAVPLPRAGEASVVGTTPLDIERPTAEYLVLLEKPGHVPVRYGLGPTRDPVHVRLPPAADAVPGCVYVPAYPERPGAFWFMEHEVTCAQYQVFLNDAETLRAIAAAPALIRVPRGPETHRSGGDWPRDTRGRYVLAKDWQPDWPVIGVSWDDAQAYAAWKTRRAQAGGENLTYTLPNYREWIAAGSASTTRSYVFGNRFRPKWMASCFGRRVPLPRAVGSMPIDESIHGAFDMSGNAVEWLDDWFDEGRKLRRVVSGSWARSDPVLFKVEGGQGYSAGFANGETGFRLVARRGSR